MACKVGFFCILALFTYAFGGFVHPGLLHTQADFNRMAQKVAANASPWIDSYNILEANGEASATYNPSPQSFVNRGSGCTPSNTMTLLRDVAASYQLALRWKISGNNSYADAAVRIMNAWSATLTGIGCQNGSSHDFLLMAGMQGYQWANAAEIMRNYSGWNTTAFSQFKTMMMNVFYPITTQYPRGLPEYANWELAMLAANLALGVLTDNQTIFDTAINYIQSGVGGQGPLAQSIYYVHPGHLGQGQEAGRDQGHNTLDVAHLTVIAQMAWNQGIDLYGYANNRILAFAEYTAKGNLLVPGSNDTYYTVPYIPMNINANPTQIWQGVFSTGSIGAGRPTWGCIYHHYVNVKGLAAPFTGQMLQLQTPEGGGGNYGSNTGGYDQIGYETLTCTLDPISKGSAPSGLTAVLVGGSVVLSWFGTANATSYNILRAPQGGAYSSVINGITDPLTYTDSSVTSPGIYNYIVVAQPGNIYSNYVKIAANPQALVLHYTFDMNNGSTVIDLSGNGYNGNLTGGTSYVSGKVSNALKLDGSSGYVQIPAGILDQLSDFTIASWVYLNGQTSNQRLFDFGYSSWRWMYFTTNSQGNPSSSSSNGNASYYITYNNGADTNQFFWTNTPLPTGQWVHLAITRYNTTTTIYVNGNSAASMTGQYLSPNQLGSATNLPAQYFIGRNSRGANSYLNGIVDDFRIYQGALTTSQVSSLYSGSG